MTFFNENVWILTTLIGKYREISNIKLLITHMKLEHRLSALLQLHLHYGLNTCVQWIEQRQLQDETSNISVLLFGASHIRDLMVCSREYNGQKVIVGSRNCRTNDYPYHQRTCAMPGVKKQINKQTNILPIGPLWKHINDTSETWIKEKIVVRKWQRLKLDVLNTRGIGNLMVNFSRTEIWSTSPIKSNCRRLIVSRPLKQSLRSRYSQIIVQWNRI